MNKHPSVSLMFEATPCCTMNCKHCYNVQKNHLNYPNKLLDTEKTIHMLSLVIKQMKCRHVTLTGGEFYTRKDADKIVEAVSNLRIKSINIMTNGSLLNKSKIQFAKDHHVSLFGLSFISANKRIFDSNARSIGFSGFDNMVHATKEIIQAGILVCHIFVATKANIETLDNTLKLSYALGGRYFSINRFNVAGNGKAFKRLQLTPTELSKALEVCNNFAISHPDMTINSPINIPPCIVNLSKYKNIHFTGCGISLKQSIIVMDYAGNIRMCNFSPTIIGNILQTPLTQMFKTDIAKNFVKALPEFCQPCKYKNKCQGGCKASADNCFNDPYAENPFLSQYKIKPIY